MTDTSPAMNDTVSRDSATAGTLRWWVRLAWWLGAAAAIAAFAAMTWQKLVPRWYHIDVDVYRQGAQAWLNGHQLYGDVMFNTHFADLPLPFTYPPMAAVLLTPLTWGSLPSATSALTVVSAVLLVVATTIVLVGLGVGTSPRRGLGPTWVQCGFLAAAIVAAAMWVDWEPVSNNFACGQINALLMALVAADCVTRRKTPWPRGLLVGIAISIKLTPAVFLLYFLLRRDWRAMLVALATFLASILIAFALAFDDSWDYWTSTVTHTGRIGDTALLTNQNYAGLLARLDLTGSSHFLVWSSACVATLVLTVWAVRRVLRTGEPVLALMCVALFGLLVSPVSWSHHWVWSVPVVVTAAMVGWRRRNVFLLVVAAAGALLMIRSPVTDQPQGDVDLIQRLIGSGYVWWALAVIVVAGATVALSPPRTLGSAWARPPVQA